MERQLRTIGKENLSSRAYSEIRNALIDGQYEPGERLTISRLANEMGVSITPVREAIFRLVSEGALEMKAATAVHVPIITAEHLREIQLIRFHLEGAAAGRAAERITPEQLQALEEIQDRFVTAAALDPKLASLHNRAFHFGLMAAGNLPTAYGMLEALWVVMGPLFQIFHLRAAPRDLKKDRHRHEDILNALRRRDSVATREALQADIAWGQIMIDWLEEREQAEWERLRSSLR
ncbi:GntR family transcriptional regulator [Ensifer sp. YR511]|uniref:GntR family transcriptional regulator n=1 Tax=Ensifer sp. YR511 TaxID=1855294 RepID=UPI00088F0DC0|nr:GntR family transcriptional regulator [Ensifer sp. YR511]SDN35534.1 transcriptional regulator, GntR family [Ensifer sp. YR511]